MRERVWVMLTLAGALCAGQSAAWAQAKKTHIRFEASVAPLAGQATGDVKYRRGEVLRLTIKGTPEGGWYTYPAVKLLPGQTGAPSRITLGKGFVPVGPITESEPKLAEDEVVGSHYKFADPFTWSQDVYIDPDLKGGEPADLSVNIEAQVCKAICTNETYTLNVPVPISAQEPAPLTPELKKSIEGAKAPPAPKVDAKAPPPTPGSFDWREYEVIDEAAVTGTGSGNGLLGLLVTAALAGLVSLATPCVFPMIPITVSIFIKQGETGKGGTLLKAIVYCGTLVAVLTAGGAALASVLQTVSQHWTTNLLLTAVFVFFGFSLLGAYDITLPSWLSDTTASGESRGGLLGIVFMALTFSVISFACVGPIYGGFTALSASDASGGWTARLLAPLVFSLAFASPFFLLALFPTLLKSLPRSGSWMNTVKVVMGFLELAAAIKFVRAAELNWFRGASFFTFDLALGIYIALAVAAALYLLAVYRLPHDHDAPESIGVTRLMFALVFIALAFYMLPGVFKGGEGKSQKPQGLVYEWAKSFLLPDETSEWPVNLPDALARAEKENKPLFIDFTGAQCTNCKYNESRYFSQPRIKELFGRFVTVQLNSDEGGPQPGQVPDHIQSRAFRDTKFKNEGLPYYVVVRVQGKKLYKLGHFTQGTINSVDEFAGFLESTLKVK